MDKQAILNKLDIQSFFISEIPSMKWNESSEGLGLCPFHEDHKKSFSVNQNTGLFFCHACNEKGDIFSFYQKKHGVDFKTALQEIAKEAGLSTEPQKRLIKTYDYVDESGNLLFQTVRYEPKNFKQRRPDGKGEWIYNLQGVRLVPYNLPEIIKAKSIIIVEGEKDVENLKTMGLTATCNPMGAGKWKSDYSQYFKGKRVVIIPDNDKPGHDHALQVATNLKGIAETIKVVELPDLKEKEDVSDWIIQGRTKEAIIKLVKQTPEWISEEPKSLLNSLLKWNDILSLDIKTEYLLDKIIPKNSINLLFGRGGIGKTSLCMQIARAIASGIPFDTLQTIQSPVYYIDFENPLAVLKERVEKIGQSENLYVWHISNEIQPPKLDSKEWELYKKLPPGLLIDDTLRASHLSDENDSKPMSLILGRLKELREMGFTILLLHHTPKGNEGIYKGSTALLDLVDHCLSIEAVKDLEGEPIEFDRDNLYRLGVRIKTRYEPHHIFLKFNPEIKGFEIAKDPDIEKLEDVLEILKEFPEGLTQKKFKEKIKDELDLTEFQARKLVKKGEGIAWDVHKGGNKNRALIYKVKSNRLIGQYIYSHPINQLNPETDKDLSNNITSDSMQSLDNSKLDNEIDNKKPINQLDVIDLTGDDVEIVL